MVLAALPQVDAGRSFALARTLGYRPMAAFAKAVMPRLYPQLRLPILAVLAYGLSVVDMSLILGPTTPSTFAVEILHLAHDPDLSRQLLAGAAATLQLGLVLGAIGLWIVVERIVAALWRSWVAAGGRQCCEPASAIAAPALACLTGVLVALAMLSLLLWSLAGSWRFPDLLPSGVGFATWEHELPSAWPLLGRSAAIATGSILVAIILTIMCLENEERRGRPSARALSLLYVPLLVPQIAFVTGLSSLLIVLRLDGGFLGVALAHLVFVLPYVFLSLAGPWRALDVRYRKIALLLGASPRRVFLMLRLPLMTGTILVSAAVGFAVSIGQYLPTLLVGAGRITTVTTEAVALAAGGDRRLIGVYALLQAAMPLMAFACAVGLPRLIFRQRRGLLHG
jgi:putative thiamine transport system permease protein